MFVTVSHFHPDMILDMIFQGKARSQSVEHSPVEGSGLTMVEVTTVTNTQPYICMQLITAIKTFNNMSGVHVINTFMFKITDGTNNLVLGLSRL